MSNQIQAWGCSGDDIIDSSGPVFVHYNINCTKKRGISIWSVKNTSPASDRNKDPSRPWSAGKLLGHVRDMVLVDCEFSVSQNGHAGVVFRSSKTVHAGVVGTLVEQNTEAAEAFPGIKVGYSPFMTICFCDPHGTPVKSASRVAMNSRGVFAEGLVFYTPEEFEAIKGYYESELARRNKSLDT